MLEQSWLIHGGGETYMMIYDRFEHVVFSSKCFHNEFCTFSTLKYLYGMKITTTTFDAYIRKKLSDYYLFMSSTEVELCVYHYRLFQVR